MLDVTMQVGVEQHVGGAGAGEMAVELEASSATIRDRAPSAPTRYLARTWYSRPDNILLDQERGRGVAAKESQKPGLDPLAREPARDRVRDLDEAPALGRDGDGVNGLAHAGLLSLRTNARHSRPRQVPVVREPGPCYKSPVSMRSPLRAETDDFRFDHSPERQLWCAVLERAFDDAMDRVAAVSFDSAQHLHLRREAREWFFGNGMEFRDACLAAGFDPDYLRGRILSLIAEAARPRDLGARERPILSAPRYSAAEIELDRGIHYLGIGLGVAGGARCWSRSRGRDGYAGFAVYVGARSMLGFSAATI